jgi:predicted metal-dependent enzyme (double-stranded beta helix superfamily)
MTPAALARELAGAPERWAAQVAHDPDERRYELLHRDSDIEVYLVCWMPGHDTGFHDHDDSAAAIAVVAGAVVEERLGLGSPVGARYDAGAVVEVPPEAIHRVRHAGTEPAVTIHAYAPPLRRVGTYEVTPDGTLLRHPRDADTRLTAS